MISLGELLYLPYIARDYKLSSMTQPQATLPCPAFVAHVKQGYEDRAIHIEAHLKERGIPFAYMLDGDISDITPERMAQYFDLSWKPSPTAEVSCAMKHLLIYEEIVRRQLPGALILEDDIYLDKRFVPIYLRSLEELRAEPNHSPALISYEDTRLKFVPRSQRRAGRITYLGSTYRMTGAYHINRAGAEAILHYARTQGVDRPIDRLHDHLRQEGLLTYWWSQPTIATQGSHAGGFSSSIQSHSDSLIRRLRWLFKINYKRLLYWLR